MPPKLEGESEQAEQAFAAGNVAKQAGNMLGALAEYCTGLESAVSVELRSALLVNRSITLATLGRYEEALADGLACAELRPSWSRTYECQAASLHGLGHMQEADASARLAAALAVLKKDPKNAESKQKVKEIRREARELQTQRLESQALQAQPSSPGFTPQTAPGAHVVPAPHAAPDVSAPSPPSPSPPPPPSPPRAAQPGTGDMNEQATNLIVEGNARQQEKDYEGALACYSSALQLSQDPDMTSAIYFNCSIANSYMERFEDALKDAEECIRVNPVWQRGFECKGTALEGLGRFREAKEIFEMALVQDPNNEPLRTTILDLAAKIDAEESRNFAPTPAEFDGILDDVPPVVPNQVHSHQSAPNPSDFSSQAEPHGDGDGLSEEERQKVRDMVKARRRQSGSFNQTLDRSPNHSLSTSQTSADGLVDSGHPNLDLTPWASDSARLNEKYALIRAREEALLQRTPQRSEGAHTAAPRALPKPADPLMEKLQRQQETIRAQGDRIKELDQIVRASAHKTGRQLEDQVAEAKDQIVALEQLSAARANEHRKLFTKLIDTLNKLDASDESLNGVDEQHIKMQQRERENAEAWIMRERERLLQEQEVDAWKIVTMGKEISKLENHATELRTQYLDKERSGRAQLETLHSAIGAKDAEIDMLDADLRKARSNLMFARKMVSKTCEASLRSETEYKISELHAHIQYMEAIKSIENLKKQVAQEEQGLEVINEKLSVLQRATEQANENSQLMAHRLVPVVPSFSKTALPASPVITSVAADRYTSTSGDGSVNTPTASFENKRWVVKETPAVAAWTPPPAWGVNPVKVPTIPPVTGTSAYEKPKLPERAQSDMERWPTLLANEKGGARDTGGPKGELSDYLPSPPDSVYVDVPAQVTQGWSPETTLRPVQGGDKVLDVWF